MRTPPKFALSLVLSVTFLTPVTARCRGDEWVGRKVVTKHDTVLNLGNGVVDDEQKRDSAQGGVRVTVRVYKVERVNGPWLWLQDVNGGARGWVKVEQVVPFDQAVEFYTREIEEDPSSEVFCSRGVEWANRKEYDRALNDYNEAIRLDPNNEVAWMDRGYAWQAKGNLDQAVADHTEAIRLDPNYADAYNNRAVVLKIKGEFDRALADYDEAIRCDPEFAPAYNNRAWLRATCPDESFRDGRMAVESASKACALSGWKRPMHLETLAASYAESGAFVESVKWQRKALGFYPKQEKGRDGSEARLALYVNNRPYREPRHFNPLAERVDGAGAPSPSPQLPPPRPTAVGGGVPSSNGGHEYTTPTIRPAARPNWGCEPTPLSRRAFPGRDPRRCGFRPFRHWAGVGNR